ncbi:MAG: hypothetical protein H7A36_06640 [Chlamydiales bacterium]|nr:hypothetical protein [Chlamydiales bacterium]
MKLDGTHDATMFAEKMSIAGFPIRATPDNHTCFIFTPEFINDPDAPGRVVQAAAEALKGSKSVAIEEEAPVVRTTWDQFYEYFVGQNRTTALIRAICARSLPNGG